MPIKLLIDPHSKRVVYVAYDGIVPERITILGSGRQYLFSPATCEQALYTGTVPAGFGPQNSWNFRYRDNRLEPACELAGARAAVAA